MLPEGGYLSPNMAAFMAAEAKKAKRKKRVGTASPAVSPPRSKSAPPSRATSPLSPGSRRGSGAGAAAAAASLRATPRKSTPGTRIPGPSPLAISAGLAAIVGSPRSLKVLHGAGASSRLPMRRAYNSPSQDTQSKATKERAKIMETKAGSPTKAAGTAAAATRRPRMTAL